ncbi:MAG: acyl-CoA thioester hydrolase [Acidobacteriota bacterium]|jgi:YbgC/YbaW family acyl-CoA thioester hydrolase
MGFRYSRRVQFGDTDMVGIVHFAMFFRYMEEAEHALWRAAGLPVIADADGAGWPRVSATFDYKAPLRFEDEFDVEVDLAATTTRTIRYAFTVRRGGTLVGTGTLTAVRARKRDGGLEAISVPEAIVTRLRAAIAADGQS